MGERRDGCQGEGSEADHGGQRREQHVIPGDRTDPAATRAGKGWKEYEGQRQKQGEDGIEIVVAQANEAAEPLLTPDDADLIQRQEYFVQQARGYRLGQPEEILSAMNPARA